MPGLLVAEDLQGRLGLREGADEVRQRGLLVGLEPAGAERRTLAQAGVDHDPVDRPEVGPEGVEHLEHLVVVVDVEGPDLHPDGRVPLGDLGAELLQAVGAAGGQREVVAAGGELAGHLRTEAGAGAGDQDGGHGVPSGGSGLDELDQPAGQR